MQPHDDIQNHLHKQEPRALQFLQELVSINSFTLNPAGVAANAQRIMEQFGGLGFEAKQVQCDRPGAGKHLILDSGGDGPVIGCYAHLDTVFSPEVEESNNFAWRPQGNRIYGPGTMDIKGGTVGLWLMLDALAQCRPEFFQSVRWILLFNAAEEVLSSDFRKVCYEHLPKETVACLGFEPDSESAKDFCLVSARKGRAEFEITVTGRNAHAGGSWDKGANAIHQMSLLIDRLQRMTNLDKDLTVNVGVVRGGSVVNTVAAQAWARLEMRCYDAAQFEETQKTIMAMGGDGEIASVSDNHLCHIEIVQTSEMPPWERNAETDKLAQTWQEAARACEQNLVAKPRGGVSDGNPLWNVFPTLDGLGPRGGNAHCAQHSEDDVLEQEFVDASSFVPKTLVNCLAVQELVGA